MYNLRDLLLSLLLFVLFHPHNKRHLDRRRRTLPPQWRDPCISPLPLPLLSPFVVALAVVLALAVACSLSNPHTRQKIPKGHAFKVRENLPSCLRARLQPCRNNAPRRGTSALPKAGVEAQPDRLNRLSSVPRTNLNRRSKKIFPQKTH